MYWLSVLFVTLAVLSAPLGLATPLSPRWDNMKVKHSWGSTPDKWECLGYPPAGTTIDLRIALKAEHESALVDALYEVSDPNHPKYVSTPLVLFVDSLTHMLRYRYGAHLSKEQVAELVTPHPEALKLVGVWLEYHSISFSDVLITHGGACLTIKEVSVTEVNVLLGASYQIYRHTETNETVIRTIGYSLPVALHEYVQMVAPTTYFASLRPLLQTSKLGANAPTLSGRDHELQDLSAEFAPGDPVPSNCSSIMTPTCLRLLYKTWGYEPQATSKNKIGITGYLGQYASYSDLTKFLTLFRNDAAASANFSVVTVNGGINNQSQPGTDSTEVRLDLHIEGE